MESSGLLKPITVEADNVPDIVVHGTFFAFYQPIVDSGGLKKMNRNHIHFSTGLPEEKQGVISGMRGDADSLVDQRERSCSDRRWREWGSEHEVLEESDRETRKYRCLVGRRQAGWATTGGFEESKGTDWKGAEGTEERER
jgi:2'-phosphotransferase